MKKYLFLSVLLLSACTFTKQQRAEKTIKAYLQEHLNDPHSYESVSFTNLEPLYNSYALEDPEGKRLDTLAATYVDSSSHYGKLADSLIMIAAHYDKVRHYQRLDTLYKRKEDSLEAIINEKGKDYKGSIYSYKINHSYRAKNGFGALGLHGISFRLNVSCDSVIYADNLDN